MATRPLWTQSCLLCAVCTGALLAAITSAEEVPAPPGNVSCLLSVPLLCSPSTIDASVIGVMPIETAGLTSAMRQSLHSASTLQTGGLWAERLLCRQLQICRQLPSVQHQLRQVVSHAALDPDDASISSSKIGNDLHVFWYSASPRKSDYT